MAHSSVLIFRYILLQILLCEILKSKIISQNFSLNRKYLINSKIENYKSTKRLLSSKKNLIIGAAVNYTWEKVQPFFKSFEAVGFENCDCIIFVSKLSKGTIKKIESCGAIIKNIPKKYQNMNAKNVRYKIYLDFLNINFDKYNLVLHVDIKDTIFQQDIFQLYDCKRPFLGIALEEGILKEKVNKEWFIYSFGEVLFKSIENERIICSGTIWGTVDKFLELLNKEWEKVKNGCYNQRIHDQTVLNYIIYIEKTFDDCLIRSEYKDGYILTLGLVKKNISFDSENNILNDKGEIAALVHQYDRIPHIKKRIRQKFCIEGKLNITKKNIFIKNKNKNNNLNYLLLLYIFMFLLIIKKYSSIFKYF